jgi:hypothetical protein
VGYLYGPLSNLGITFGHLQQNKTYSSTHHRTLIAYIIFSRRSDYRLVQLPAGMFNPATLWIQQWLCRDPPRPYNLDNKLEINAYLHRAPFLQPQLFCECVCGSTSATIDGILIRLGEWRACHLALFEHAEGVEEAQQVVCFQITLFRELFHCNGNQERKLFFLPFQFLQCSLQIYLHKSRSAVLFCGNRIETGSASTYHHS